MVAVEDAVSRPIPTHQKLVKSYPTARDTHPAKTSIPGGQTTGSLFKATGELSGEGGAAGV